MIPVLHGLQKLESSYTGTTSAELGASVAATATPHQKNTTYTTLIASTSEHSYGIFVRCMNTAVATTITDALVDIAIGAAASETVIIPNLIAGHLGATGIASMGMGGMYFFPIVIPSGTRISATAQGTVVSDTVHVAVHLLQCPLPGMWYGQRVTAYGADTGNSRGTALSPGNNTYVDATVTASTTNPIKAVQIGIGGQGDTGFTNLRGLARITAGGTVIADQLPYMESTTVEEHNFVPTNFLLSHMRFNLPAGISLSAGLMRNGAAEARSVIVYGVD